MANFWGEAHFKHPRCVTQNILKTRQRQLGDGSSEITVYAHSYEAIRRMYYEKVWGGDGRLYTVPVEWYEYLPVTGSGSIFMNEDTNDDTALTPVERQSHIADSLNDVGGSGIYRRHIASRL